MNGARLTVPRVFVAIAYKEATTRKTAKARSLADRVRDDFTLHQEIKPNVEITVPVKTPVRKPIRMLPTIVVPMIDKQSNTLPSSFRHWLRVQSNVF